MMIMREEELEIAIKVVIVSLKIAIIVGRTSGLSGVNTTSSYLIRAFANWKQIVFVLDSLSTSFNADFMIQLPISSRF
jgi:hypothetical protein